MLEIYTNGQLTDLSPDIEISLTWENPMLLDDGIPAPYTLDYELPLSPRNRQLFGYPDRLASDSPFRKIPSLILFDGVVIGTGTQRVEEVGETISVTFTGANFPPDIRKYLYCQSFGQLNIGTVDNPESGMYYDSSRSREYYNDLLRDNAESANAFMIAPPIGISNVDYPASDDSDSFNRQNRLFINSYRWGYAVTDPTGTAFTHLSKILPVFRVGWMLDTLFGGAIENNLFNAPEWLPLVLVSRWHPKYQVENDFPVFDLDKKTGNVSIAYADFMPKVQGSKFVSEILKIPCAAMFVQGGRYSIELKRDLLMRTDNVQKWSDKIMGTPSISLEDGKEYTYGYNGDDGKLSDEIIPVKVATIGDMFRDAYSGAELKTYEIGVTGQVIESLFDTDTGNRFKFHVVRQAMGGFEETESDDPDSDERSSYDAKFAGTVLWNNLRLDVGRDGETMARYGYVPEGEVIGTERPEDLTVGLYWGMDYKMIDKTWETNDEYPYLSHCNYDARGNRRGEVTLHFDGQDGLMENYHKEFRNWIEKDKRLVTVQVNLNPLDLHGLDLRNKVEIHNRLYFIKTLSVSLTLRRVSPSDVELVEV